MRAALLLAIAHAAAFAALCAAGDSEHAALLSAEEECECCAAKVTQLQSHLDEVYAENIALRKVNERQASDLGECRAEGVKQPLVWRLAADHDHDRELSSPLRRHKGFPTPPLPQTPPASPKGSRLSCSNTAYSDPNPVHADPDDRHSIGDAERLARANDHSDHNALAAG